MFGWETLTFDGEVNASWIEQRSPFSCVPTCIAMLVWNLGYGLGLESSAIREGYAVAGSATVRDSWWPPSSVLDARYDDMRQYYDGEGVGWDDVPELLGRYGLNHTHYRRTSRRGGNPQVLPATLAAVGKLQQMQDGDASLLAAMAGGTGGMHCWLLYRRGGTFFILNPADRGRCTASRILAADVVHTDDGTEYTLNVTVGEVTVWFVQHVYFVPSQTLLANLWNRQWRGISLSDDCL